MTEPRPYPPTEWEEAQGQDASDAVDDANAAVLHADATMQELIESGNEIAANTAAVAKLTRDGLIADNKRFRRRNAVLVFLSCVLILGMGFMIYRDIYINAPERDRITQQTDGLQDANAKLDHIEEFIEDVQNNDGDGVTRQELEVVFDAVFDTKAMVECVITAPDEAAVADCADVSP